MPHPRSFLAAAALLPLACGLTVTPEAAAPPHPVYGRQPPKAALHVAATFGNAFAATTATSGCDRGLRLYRAHHGDPRQPHARFWTALEFDTNTGGHQLWFNKHELAVGDIFAWALAAADPAAAGVVDVGANVGWYSLFAAVRGFHVDAIDMQPECTRRARCATVLNRLAQRVDVFTAYVTDGSDGGAFLPVAATHCYGGTNPAWQRHFEWPGYRDRVPPLHLGRHVLAVHAATGRRVRVLKVDIEGGEVAVARSLAAAPGALQLVDHVVAEYSPHMWGDLNVSAPAGVAAFGAWFAAGFVVVDVPESRRIDPARWAAAPGTPDAPEFGLPRGSVLRSTADLARYTEWALAEYPRGFRIFTLWFFRPGDGGSAQAAANTAAASPTANATAASTNTTTMAVEAAAAGSPPALHLDFVEIGTSDFDTLIQTAGAATTGLSVEPLCGYLDALPSPPHVAKLCAAVTGTLAPGAPRTAVVHYVEQGDIAAHGLSTYLRGCSSLGAPHPTAARELAARGLDHLQRNVTVPLLSVGELWRRVASVGLLKLDTEGHDTTILAGLVAHCDAHDRRAVEAADVSSSAAAFWPAQPTPPPSACWPRRILFESNVLTPRRALLQTVAALAARGYVVVDATDDDTLLERRRA